MPTYHLPAPPGRFVWLFVVGKFPAVASGIPAAEIVLQDALVRGLVWIVVSLTHNGFMTDTINHSQAGPALELLSVAVPDVELEVVDSAISSDLAAFLSPAQKPDELGRLGGYRVLKLLGEGGMGYVFLAEDDALQRSVALKVMKPEVILEENAKERFFREARAAARVKHDHVITIHQVGEDRGIPFLALEYLEGHPLDKYLKEMGEVALPEALRITKEIAAGLGAAHRQGLIHRDIKPANIWLEAPGGRVKILDFGLARHLVEDTHLTKTGEVVGTPAFMSPEQARDQAIDHRSDLFSLGIIFYRLCTGRQPFHGATTMAVLTALAVDNPVAPSQLNRIIPIYLEQVILRLLEKEPAKRYQSAQELGDALNAIEDRLSAAAKVKDRGLDMALVTPPSVKSSLPKPPGSRFESTVTERTTAPKPPALATPSRLWRHKKLVLLAALIGLCPALAWIVFFRTEPKQEQSRRSAPAAPEVEETPIKLREKYKPIGEPPAGAFAPFEPRQARALQDTWAGYLHEKVEIENSIGMPLALIPPGKFRMGASDQEPGSIKREVPQHDVEISQPFYLGVTEVTQEQYERIMKTNPSRFRKEQGGGANFPVEQVTWQDAVAFCNALSKLPEEAAAGRVYRLPTEAEWEYACRAGSRTAFPHASRPLKDYAWYQDNSGSKPQPVRQLLPNPWGLYDMMGNVWEWCGDYFEEAYYDQRVAKDPRGPSSGSDRVMRGGCWAGPSRTCRSAYRDGLVPGIRNETFGFRVCFTLE